MLAQWRNNFYLLRKKGSRWAAVAALVGISLDASGSTFALPSISAVWVGLFECIFTSMRMGASVAQVADMFAALNATSSTARSAS